MKWRWGSDESSPASAIAAAARALDALEEEARFDASAPALADAFARVTELGSWLECRLALDGADPDARAHASEIEALGVRLEVARRPREAADGPMLVIDAEVHRPWAKLHGQIGSGLRVEGPDGVRGLAEATRELQHPERAVREASHSAIARAWEPHRATLACAMSALIAWRRATEGDVLARALSRFRLEARTLEALLGALHDREGLAARALAAVARSRGWDAVAPWDLAAPPPAIPAMALADGLTLIEQAFDAVDPRMGDTLRELASAGRIDADRGPRRRPGAFAAPFPLKRAARVFVSWSGTLADLRILGHELGHAFHYTLIRDGSPLEIDVPPSLVELPSSFAELAVAAELERASDPALVAAARAQDLLFAAAMIGIMPARFDLEREVTALGRSVTPEELDRMNGVASRRWLGEGGPIDPASWTRPHHYYGVGTRFAHITYTLGYLLALGLHSRRTPFEAITGFVRDLARRSVEDCARLHLGTDLGDRTFFASALDLVEARVGAAAA